MNQTSVWSLTVPVFPATGCGSTLAAVAVPPVTTPRIIETIVNATYGSITLYVVFSTPRALRHRDRELCESSAARRECLCWEKPNTPTPFDRVELPLHPALTAGMETSAL